MEAQGSVNANKQERMWNLSTTNMIIILACLCGAMLIFIIIIIILSIFLCVTKRRYSVERSANLFRSETSTMDGISTVESQGGLGKNY
jgi:hypothetical protein